MKKILLCLLVGVSASSFAQNETYNYEVEDRKVYWRKVFEADGLDADSLQSLVKNQILLNGIKIVGETKGEIRARLDKYMFRNMSGMGTALGSFNVDAAILIEFKDGRYRAELNNIFTNMSTNMSYQSAPMRYSEEKQLLKADGTIYKNGVKKFMSQRNEEFTWLFELQKQNRAKKDF